MSIRKTHTMSPRICIYRLDQCIMQVLFIDWIEPFLYIHGSPWKGDNDRRRRTPSPLLATCITMHARNPTFYSAPWWECENNKSDLEKEFNIKWTVLKNKFGYDYFAQGPTQKSWDSTAQHSGKKILCSKSWDVIDISSEMSESNWNTSKYIRI